jgi:hypothetical protein
MIARRGAPTRRQLFALALGAALVLAASGAMILAADAGTGDDVYFIHERAAKALARGLSPYGPAVEVPDNSPFAAPGATIVGYSYPPPALLAYAASSWILGDSRWTGLLAFVLVVVALGGRASRADAATASMGRTAACLLLASLPSWPRMLEEGWTEPVSLALLTVSALAWARPWAASIALGCALASKQYFLLAAPAVGVALLRASRGRLRALVTIVTGLACLAPALLDPRGFWRAAIRTHLERPPRPDGAGLVSVLTRLTPMRTWPSAAGAATLLLCWIVGVAAARRAPRGAGPWAATALVLGVGAFLSPQGSPNYWFIASGASALALVVDEPAGVRP